MNKSCKILSLFFVGISVLLLLSSSAAATSTRFLELQGFSELLAQDLRSTALTATGNIVLPPPAHVRYRQAEMMLAAAATRGSTVYGALADVPEVIAVDKKGKRRTIYKAKKGIACFHFETNLLTVNLNRKNFHMWG